MHGSDGTYGVYADLGLRLGGTYVCMHDHASSLVLAFISIALPRYVRTRVRTYTVRSGTYVRTSRSVRYGTC